MLQEDRVKLLQDFRRNLALKWCKFFRKRETASLAPDSRTCDWLFVEHWLKMDENEAGSTDRPYWFINDQVIAQLTGLINIQHVRNLKDLRGLRHWERGAASRRHKREREKKRGQRQRSPSAREEPELTGICGTTTYIYNFVSVFHTFMDSCGPSAPVLL